MRKFVPAVVDVGVPAPARGRQRQATRYKSKPDIGTIEVEVGGGVTIRAGHGADANLIAAIVQALKASR